MRRENVVVGVLVVVALTGAATVAARTYDNGAFSGPPTVDRRITQADAAGPTIQWLGDTMLGDAAEPTLEAYGHDWALGGVAPLVSADLTIANAEAPLTTSTSPWGPDKVYRYRSDPEAARALAGIGIDAMSLSNNHAMDHGPTGASDTDAHLDAAGIDSFGAGDTIDDARRPLMVTADDRTIAVLGFGENFGRSNTATEHRPGIVVMTPQSIDDGYERARSAGADDVVAFVHWGDNYGAVNAEQQAMAGLFADAGYRMVVGAGPHVVQPVTVVDGMPVVNSLGNFVFGSNGRFEQFSTLGLGIAVTTRFNADDSVTMVVRCLSTDNAQVAFRPVPCTGPQALAVIPSLHPSIQMWGDTGLLQLPPRDPPGSG